MPGATPARPAGRSRRSSSECVAGSTVGSSCVRTGVIRPGTTPGNSTCTGAAFCHRAATVCGSGALTRRAFGSYTVNSARPGIAMSPSTTETSATTPA